jgi:hypothetical protein
LEGSLAGYFLASTFNAGFLDYVSTLAFFFVPESDESFEAYLFLFKLLLAALGGLTILYYEEDADSGSIIFLPLITVVFSSFCLCSILAVLALLFLGSGSVDLPLAGLSFFWSVDRVDLFIDKIGLSYFNL